MLNIKTAPIKAGILILLSVFTLLLFAPQKVHAQPGSSCSVVGDVCCNGTLGGRVCGGGLFCSTQDNNGRCQTQDPTKINCDQVGENCCDLGLGGGRVCGGGLFCSQTSPYRCQTQDPSLTACDQIEESCCDLGLGGGRVCGGGLTCSQNPPYRCQSEDPNTTACDQEGERCCNRGSLGGGFVCGGGLFCSTSDATGICQADNPFQGNTGNTTTALIRGSCPSEHIETAIGCIPFGSSSALVTFFVSWGLGIGGGVAMLSLIYAGFMTMTSAGDPKRLEMGKELVVSSLSGIVLLAFSIFVLRLIGVDILGLFGN